MARDAFRMTIELEDRLLDLWQQRRKLSEKALCAKFGCSRSTLRNAVRRAEARRWRTLSAAQALPAECGT